jgi:hypothetical protein
MVMKIEVFRGYPDDTSEKGTALSFHVSLGAQSLHVLGCGGNCIAIQRSHNTRLKLLGSFGTFDLISLFNMDRERLAVCLHHIHMSVLICPS